MRLEKSKYYKDKPIAEREKEIVGGREKAKGDILYC